MMVIRELKDNTQKKKLFVTLPTNLEVEIDIIQVAIRIVSHLLDQKLEQTTIEEDETNL
jgi:hypothetical protein